MKLISFKFSVGNDMLKTDRIFLFNSCQKIIYIKERIKITIINGNKSIKLIKKVILQSKYKNNIYSFIEILSFKVLFILSGCSLTQSIDLNINKMKFYGMLN